jgi:hypothetical protein
LPRFTSVCAPLVQVFRCANGAPALAPTEVRINIYRLETTDWSLEVVDETGAGQNQLRREASAKTRCSNSLLRGQATHEHFSIEASAVVMPVRTTVAPSEFLTRINALSLFSMRRARASARQPNRPFIGQPSFCAAPHCSFIGQPQNLSNDWCFAVPNNFEREH